MRTEEGYPDPTAGKAISRLEAVEGSIYTVGRNMEYCLRTKRDYWISLRAYTRYDGADEVVKVRGASGVEYSITVGRVGYVYNNEYREYMESIPEDGIEDIKEALSRSLGLNGANKAFSDAGQGNIGEAVKNGTSGILEGLGTVLDTFEDACVQMVEAFRELTKGA